MNSLYLLAIVIFFNQGIGSLASQPLYYFLRETLGISVSTIMMMGAITNLPWMIKPLYGFLSDSCPLPIPFAKGRYKRKPYIIISGIICAVAALLIGLSPFTSVYILLSFMFLSAVGMAGDNVAVNGMVVEEGNKLGITGKLQSVEWGALGVGQVLTGVLGGYIAEKGSYHLAYLILALFPILIAVMAFRHKEEKVVPVSDKPVIKDFILKLKDKQILLAALFLFFLWFSPSFGTPLMDKMRTDLHLTKVWIGWLNTIGATCGVLGAVAYFKMSTKLDMKKWLYFGTVLSALATYAYLYLTPTTVLLYTIVFGLSGQFIHLLMLNMMALTCPEGTEATTYALLCSLVNCASFFSDVVGAKCYTFFGYNGLVIISGTTTLLCLGFIPFLRMRK